MPTSSKASPKRRPSKGNKAKNVVLAVLCVFAATIAAGLVASAIAVSSWLQNIPDVSDLGEYSRSGIATIYASDKKTVLATITSENRIEVANEDISDLAKQAVVAVEDERFYEHGAIDPIAMVRALVSTLGGSTQGASTLTQQLARNTVLRDEMTDRTLARKVREAYVAMKMEEKYSKDEILAAYLNIVNFGNSNYGIEAASQDYFRIHASELDLAQAAFLAGIPNSPTLYDPRTNFAAAKERQEHVLARMEENGLITADERKAAEAEEIEISDAGTSRDDVKNIAPYFADYVKSLLENDSRYDVGGLGGCSIYTTLDVADQKAARTAVKEVMADSDLDASLCAIDPENGYIIAMIGGRNHKKNNFNLATQMRRQAGSTFKPFTLIAAMERGISPEAMFDSSSPAEITDTWTVNNAEGAGHGYMTLRAATTNSVNTVYARLAHEIGAQAIADTARSLGIRSALTVDETITLGTSGVNTMEMASAYATIASGGIYREPVAITSIKSESGHTLYELDEGALEGDRVISQEIAEEAIKVLETVVTSGTATNARLANGQVAAGKTGTSEHGRDLWFCAFTPQISCAVWTGYRTEKSTGLYGGTTSTPIWKEFMDAALEDEEPEKFFFEDDTTGSENSKATDDTDDEKTAPVFITGGYAPSTSSSKMDKEDTANKDNAVSSSNKSSSSSSASSSKKKPAAINKGTSGSSGSKSETSAGASGGTSGDTEGAGASSSGGTDDKKSTNSGAITDKKSRTVTQSSS